MARNIVYKEVVNILGGYLYTSNRDTNRFMNDGSRRLQPLDRFLRSYFNNNPVITKAERSLISTRVFDYVKYEQLLAYLSKSSSFDCNKHYTFDSHQQQRTLYKLQLLHSSDFFTACSNPSLPLYLRASQNKLLFKQLSLSLLKAEEIMDGSSSIMIKNKRYELGNEKAAFDASVSMNQRAALTLRVNPLKTTKWKAIQKQFKVRLMKCQFAPFGFRITQGKNFNLLQTPEFEAGHFEIQDEASQLAAMRIKCSPGQTILDFCGGTKSLAVAHLTEGKGQIHVYEPRQVPLGKIKKRYARAGVNNVKFHSSQDSLNKHLLRKADWVIVDAPSTGTGTLRRNPQLKLQYCDEFLQRSINLQRDVFDRAIKYLRQDGRIVYITCSLLRQENQEQALQFCKHHHLQIENDQVMKIVPDKNEMDGFFAVVLKYRS